MKPSFLKVFFVITLSAFLLVNCKKSNDIISESYITQKEWIHENGGIYKNETITMTSNDGSVNTGKLNWSSVDTFNIGQTKYTEIPFYFPTLSVRKNSNNVFVENVSFSLVIRTVNGITEAAVKITQRNVKVKNVNTEKLGSIEYYSNLEGEQLNIWFINHTGKIMTMRKQNQNKIASFSTTAKTSLSDAVNDCISFNVPMYDYQCWITGGEYNETACGWKLTAGTNYLFCWTDSNGDNGSANLWPSIENRGEGGGGEFAGGANEDDNGINYNYQFPLKSDYIIKYPKFAELIKNIYLNSLKNSAILDLLMSYSHMTSIQIFNVMKFNQGPTIVIEDINAPPYNGRTRYAYFNSNQPDVIHIDLKTVTNFENTTNYKQNQAYTLFLVATILHETVHYGNNLNNFNEGRYDFGDGFEIDAYGSIIELKEF